MTSGSRQPDSPTLLTRRTILAVSSALPFASATAACAEATDVSLTSGSKTLVVYFTRSGNTQVIAETLQRTLKTDIFRIMPAVPYPADYEENVRRANDELERGYLPPLAYLVSNFERYETLFLGHPIWAMRPPPVIGSFLRRHDTRGKTIRPFITHGGFGIGESMRVLTEHAAGARIEVPFIMEADQEKRTLAKVRGWIGGGNLTGRPE